MPLAMSDMGKEYVIKAVTGNDKTKHHLETLGFTPGAKVVVVSQLNGNLIISVRETRLALSRQLANKVLVE